MPIDFPLKRSACVAAAVAAAFPASVAAAGAARIDFAIGDVKAVRADGSARPLARGAEVDSGEMVDTGSGRAQMRFADGALVSLQPQTQFRIDAYQYAAKPAEDRSFLSLIKGGLRTITGLIGKGNRDAYKLSTSVATIGIRGTEFSVVYGNSINVTTGQGAVEMCNDGGCLTLNAGESGYVKNNETAPVLTEKKNDLPPPPPSPPRGLMPPQDDKSFVVGENRNDDGTLDVFGSLPSGPGYFASGIGLEDDGYGGTLVSGFSLQGSATFSGSVLSTMDGTDMGAEGAYVAKAGSVAEAHQDGIIGWGRWSSGTLVDVNCGSCDTALMNLHYVVGKPTSSVELAALQGTVGTYTVSGATAPTSALGGFTGGTVTGSMTANFSNGNVTVSLNVPIHTYHLALTGSGSITNPGQMSGSLSCSGGDCSGGGGYFSGLFAGAQAQRAGISYYSATGLDIGKVSGAAVFSKTSSAAAPN